MSCVKPHIVKQKSFDDSYRSSFYDNLKEIAGITYLHWLLISTCWSINSLRWNVKASYPQRFRGDKQAV
jgi:hypothetical protein